MNGLEVFLVEIHRGGDLHLPLRVMQIADVQGGETDPPMEYIEGVSEGRTKENRLLPLPIDLGENTPDLFHAAKDGVDARRDSHLHDRLKNLVGHEFVVGHEETVGPGVGNPGLHHLSVDQSAVNPHQNEGHRFYFSAFFLSMSPGFVMLRWPYSRRCFASSGRDIACRATGSFTNIGRFTPVTTST